MIPIKRRRAVPRDEVLAIFATAPVLDVADLRRDLDAGELSSGSHATDDLRKRAGRVAVLQYVESAFEPLPYDQHAARLYGQTCAAVRAAGHQPRKRAPGLMIAATAASNALPISTANPDDFRGSEDFVELAGVRGQPNTF